MVLGSVSTRHRGLRSTKRSAVGQVFTGAERRLDQANKRVGKENMVYLWLVVYGYFRLCQMEVRNFRRRVLYIDGRRKWVSLSVWTLCC